MEIPASFIFALTVAAILFLFMIRHAYELCASWLNSAGVKNWLFTHLYPQLIKRSPVNPPVSWANIITQVLYWAGTAIFNTVGVTSLADGSNRALSLIAFNFIPLLMSDRIAFAADLLDLSSRTVLQIHQSVGFMTVIQATLHLVLQIINEGLHLDQSRGLYSLMAAIALVVLLLLTIPLFRRYFYEPFIWIHFPLSVLAIYAIWRRLGSGIQQNHIFLVIAGGLYVSTAVLRIIRTFFNSFSSRYGWSRAEITKYQGATRLSITLPRLRKFRPGQYVYLCIPAASLTSIFQSHPYSVAWWEENPEGTTDKISILVKSQRGFSRDLQTLSSAQKQVLVSVDGPYGRVIDTSSFATLVLLATSIGIAQQISLVKDAMRDMKASKNSLRRISIIWQMDEEIEEAWVNEWMQQLLDEDEHKLLFCHQYVAGGFRDELSAYGRTRPYGHRVAKLYGRADIQKVLAKEFELAVGRILVAVAANNEFRDEIRSLSATFDFRDVEYEELNFQPEGVRNFWAFKKQQQDFKGVI